MNEIHDDAVVLRTYKSGESDRVVVLWTKEHGKMRAIAKGVRKQGSRLGGGLEPLAYVEMNMARGRGDLNIVRQVLHRERFTILRSSYERIVAGMAMVEVVDAIPLDDVADEDIFTMLVRALATLDNPQYQPALVPTSFFFKIMVHDGSEPVLDSCVSCGREGPLVSFDAEVGGTLCASCRSGRALSPDALTLLRRILGGDLANVLREVSPAGSSEVITLAQETIEQHLGKRLKVARSSPPLG